jgi:hypothetical protein
MKTLAIMLLVPVVLLFAYGTLTGLLVILSPRERQYFSKEDYRFWYKTVLALILSTWLLLVVLGVVRGTPLIGCPTP